MQSATRETSGYGGGEERPWYVKYGISVGGTAAGGLAMFFGILNFAFRITSVTCIIFSIWQIFCGLFVILIEMPHCCLFLERIHKVTDFINRKPLWVKAAAYFGIPLPVIIACFGVWTFLGSGSIMAVGGVYAFIFFRRKARGDIPHNPGNVQSRPVENVQELRVEQPRPSPLPPDYPTYPEATPTFVEPATEPAAQWNDPFDPFNTPPTNNAPSTKRQAPPPRPEPLNIGENNDEVTHSSGVSWQQNPDSESSV